MAAITSVVTSKFTAERSFVLLPHAIEQNAKDDPDGLFASVPSGAAYTEGFRDVTKLQFLKAIDHVAALLDKTFGKGQNFETLTYIGQNDIRYSVIVVAGIKAGYKVFLPSPRNSQDAHLSLLNKLQCSKLVVTETPLPCVPTILSEKQMSTLTIPSLHELLDLTTVESYPYSKTWEESKTDPIYVLHTSGSTGLPKPMIQTNEFISRLVTAAKLPPPDGHVDINSYFRQGKFFITLPPFHLTGLAFTLVVAAYYGSIPVYPLATQPPTTESFMSAVESTKVDWGFIPPVVIDEIGKNPDLLERLASRVKYLFFTGGAVPKASGDVVARKIPIWQVLGSTECASIPLVHAKSGYSNAEHWQYVSPNPKLGVEWRPRVDGQCELIVKKSEHNAHFQPVFSMFPSITEFETRDLFKQHPEKEGLWLMQSRIDDIIVFLNGEKTNPVSFEETVMSHPDVKAALVIGAQRFEAALLVEPASNKELTEAESKAIVESIWPLVEKANAVTPKHAAVSKKMILVADPKVPFLRAGKGTVQRNATLALYAGEIDSLYQHAETSDETAVSATGDIKSVIRNVVAEMVGWDDLNFFQLGLDSLGVLRLQRALKARLPGAAISLNTIYSNASVNSLVAKIEELTNPIGVPILQAQDPTKELRSMLDSFMHKIDAITPMANGDSASTGTAAPVKVLLSGSTGALGSYILHRLLSLPEVAHIYCFNRTADAPERQVRNCASRRLTTEFPVDRVTFLAGDFTKPFFDLDEAKYHDLSSNVTHITHNAWPVNFNLSLASFSPSIEGVIGLITLAATSPLKPSIQFLSSISSVSRCTISPVPEHVLPDLGTPEMMGYGQSKYLSERVLDYAAQKLDIKTSSVRIGQVAGAARTASGWNRQEWLPSLVVSSAFIGALPETIGDVPKHGEEMINWVPMDYLADVLVELALGKHESTDLAAPGVQVNQVTHAHPVPWKELLEATKAELSAKVKVVPYAEWLSVLKAKSEEAEKDENLDPSTLAFANPAMKLIDFFDGVGQQGDAGLRMQLGLEKTLTQSKILRDMEPLKVEWMAGWTRDWMSAHLPTKH